MNNNTTNHCVGFSGDSLKPINNYTYNTYLNILIGHA